jgi:hypothetical protein
MAVTNLPFIQQQMIRYGMSTYLALGIMGNICSLIMFTRHPYRKTPSSIYFLALSIFAIIYLIWSVVPLLYTLNHIDPQTQLLFYCKIRTYVTHVIGQCNRYIVVFACIDRFFVTRTSVRIRSLSSVRMAIKLVFIICPVWLLIAIHVPILMDIRDGVCGMFGLYKLIFAFYQIIVASIVPLILMCIFSILAFRSLYRRHIARARARQRDRNLMHLVIAEVIVTIITSIPSSANLIYGAATYYVVNKSTERLEIESFLNFIGQFAIYLLNVAPFYLFLLASKPFRNDFINIFVKCWDKYILRRVRIVPLNERNNIATMNGRVIHDRNNKRLLERRLN